MKEKENIVTLCVQVAFGVSARLIKARVRCSDEVAVNRDVFRVVVEELIPLVVVDELIDKKISLNEI